MNSKEKTKYRSTKRWKDFRKSVLVFFNFTCQLCGQRLTGKRQSKLQVHHKDETKYGNEQMKDVTLLCSYCHDMVEHWRRKKILTEYAKMIKEIIDEFFVN